MATPKAYVYEFEKVKAVICAYSIDLFNIVLKSIRSDCETYTKELEMISHKIYNKSSCNCKETIKDLSIKMTSKLKTFKKVIIPLEFLELEYGTSHLLICEIYKSSKKSGCKFAVINTAAKTKRDSNAENREDELRPKYCLLRLFSVFTHDMLGLGDSVGRNNSLIPKNTMLKNCFKEISRELAGKGALPSDLSQKCLHSRDTNRCWFDYSRIMDICINYKVSAKDIAELIKQIAAIDPMQPDPVMCIKGRLGITGHHGLGNTKKQAVSSDNSEAQSQSQSSSDKTSSTSSSTSEMITKSRSPNNPKNKSHRDRVSPCKRKHRTSSRCKSISKETQTFNLTQSETQTDAVPCHCYRRTLNAKLSPSRATDGSFNKYLWTPELYDGNEYDDPMSHYNEYDDEPLFDEENQYQNYGDIDGEINYDTYDGDHFHARSTGSLVDPTNYREEDYDNRLYDDFLRQREYLGAELEIKPKYNVKVEETQLRGMSKKDQETDGRRRRMNSLSAKLQPSMKFHLKSAANNPTGSKYGNGSNSVDPMRSSSQPMLPSKNQSEQMFHNSNNSQGECQTQLLSLPLPIIAVESGTQTNAPSPNLSDGLNSQMKKYASEGNILQKVCIENNDNNSTTESTNALSHVAGNTLLSLNACKTFKMEAVQTDSEYQHREEGFFIRQRKYDSMIPKYIHGKLADSNSSMESHQRIIANMPNIARSSRQHSIMMTEDRYASMKHIFDAPSYTMNRNDNNHSISRSPSSRNSQIVEVDNENMEKIPSVIVDQDSRPIIYFTSREDLFDQSPFYEKGETSSDIVDSDRPNTNINNSIRSVTVSNRDPTGTQTKKCSVNGCHNVAEGYKYTCENHGVIRSQSCSPERCLSRLSCIVALNRQMLAGDISPKESAAHQTALRRVLHGFCEDNNDCNFDKPIPGSSSHPLEPSIIPDEYLASDIPSVMSPSNQDRRCNANASEIFRDAKLHYMNSTNQPLHSALKMSNGHFVECYPLDYNTTTGKETSQVNNLHNAAQIFHQSEPVEQLAPMHSLPISDCHNATVTRCQNETNVASYVDTPLSNIGVTSDPYNRGQDCTNVEAPKYKVWREGVTDDDYEQRRNEVYQSKTNDYKVVNSQGNQTNERQIPMDKVINSCNLTFPLTFQVCPITGCRNITTTGQPACLKLQSCSNAQDRIPECPRFLSSRQTYETVQSTKIKQEQAMRAQKNHFVSLQDNQGAESRIPSNIINHGELHNLDSIYNNEVIFNDARDIPSKQRSIQDDMNVKQNRDLSMPVDRLASMSISKQSASVPKISLMTLANGEENTDRSHIGPELEVNNSRPVSGINANYLPTQEQMTLSEKLMHDRQLSISPNLFKSYIGENGERFSSQGINLDTSEKHDRRLSTNEPGSVLNYIKEESLKSIGLKSNRSVNSGATFKSPKDEPRDNVSSVKVEFNDSAIKSPDLEVDEQIPSLRDNPDLVAVELHSSSPKTSDFQKKTELQISQDKDNLRVSVSSTEDSSTKNRSSSRFKSALLNNDDIIAEEVHSLSPNETDVQRKSTRDSYNYKELRESVNSLEKSPDSNQDYLKSQSFLNRNPDLIAVEIPSPVDTDISRNKGNNVEISATSGENLLSKSKKTVKTKTMSARNAEIMEVDMSKLSTTKSDLKTNNTISEIKPEKGTNIRMSVTSVERTSKKERSSTKVQMSSVRNVSTSSKQTLQAIVPCWGNNDLYSSVVDMPVSPRGSHKSQNPSNNNSSCDNGNNECNNDNVMMDYLYLDGQSTKVRSRIFSDTIIFNDPDCLLLGKCDNMFYSTPELILNKHCNHILVSERWDIQSDLVLENLDNMTISIPALVDHPSNEMVLLISLSVYLLFCNQLPVLMHFALMPSKIKKSKINRLLKSLGQAKESSQFKNDSKLVIHHKFEKIELIKKFKNKMAKIIKKCRSTKLGCQLKGSNPSTFSMNHPVIVRDTCSEKSLSDEEECIASISTVDPSEYIIRTRSCNNMKRVRYNPLIGSKQWNSEPFLARYEPIKLARSKLILSSTEISTSDLSLLCAEVLKKLNGKCIIDPRMGDDMSTDRLCRSTTLPEYGSLKDSSKDTLKLIIKALKYLHHSHLDDSGPSNKTLDSVSSIKTCSEDRLESIRSLRQKIVRPRHKNRITISAYNKIP